MTLERLVGKCHVIRLRLELLRRPQLAITGDLPVWTHLGDSMCWTGAAVSGPRLAKPSGRYSYPAQTPSESEVSGRVNWYDGANPLCAFGSLSRLLRRPLLKIPRKSSKRRAPVVTV